MWFLALTLKQAFAWLNDVFIRYLDWFRNTRFGRKFMDIVYDTAILVSYLGAFALIHELQQEWLGGDYVLFGKYKLEYIIHLGHLMALVLFFLEIARTGVEVLRGIVQIFLGILTDIREAIKQHEQSD